MIKSIKQVLISLIVALSMVLGMSSVYANADTAKRYFESNRSGGVKVTSTSAVKKISTINSLVPSTYSFPLGKKATTNFHPVSGTSLTTTELRELLGDNSATNDHGRWVKTYDKKNGVVNNDKIAGKYWALYEDVGKYNGTSIDVKVTVTEYHSYGVSGKYSALALRTDGPGVQVRGIRYVKLRYNFYKHGTVNSSGDGTAVNVKGYTTYWDIDLYQGIHFINNNVGLYASDSNVLYYNKDKDDAKPFIYENNVTGYGISAVGYTPYINKVSVTELFEGTSITRGYTFARPKDKTNKKDVYLANGTIVNTAKIDGGIKEYSDFTPAGANGAQVNVGDTIRYKITITNGVTSSSSISVKDTLSKGLKYKPGSTKLYNVSKSDPTPVNGYVDSGQTITWTNLTTLRPGESTFLVYDVIVTDKAVTKVKNSAQVKFGTKAYINVGSLTNPVPKPEPQPGEFTADKDYDDNSTIEDGKSVRVNDEITYKITWQNGNGNTTIEDTLGEGLEFVGMISASDPQPQVEGQKLTWTNLTETAGSIRYKVKVKPEAAGQQVCNDATATSGKTIELAQLCNPVPNFTANKTYASTTGENNDAVKVNDEITYQISWNDGNGDVKIEDTLDEGLEFIGMESGDDPQPQVDGQKLTWDHLTDENGSINYKVKVKSEAEGAMVCNNAKVSSGEDVKELEELCNPVPVKKYGGSSLNDNSGWDHHEVIKGNDIKYKVTLPNAQNETISVVVSDVLSKGLAYNNDASVEIINNTSELNSQTTATEALNVTDPVINSDTKTTTLGFTVTIPAKVTAVLTYSAKVNEDAVNLVNNIANANYGNGPYQIGTLHNPVPKKAYDVNTASGMNGKTVKKDDVITYNIGYSNGYLENATINLKDTLSKGLKYIDGTAQVCTVNNECVSIQEKGITEQVISKDDGTTEIYWTRTNMPSLGIEYIKYDVLVTGETIKVNNDFDIKICKSTETTADGTCNSPWVDIEELHNPIPSKKYNSKTPSGYNHRAVVKNNKIRYEIRYVNVADTNVTATIKDTLSNGIKYVKGTSKVNGKTIQDPVLSNNNKTLTWTRDMAKGKEETLTYEVLVTGETIKVKNKATITYSNNPNVKQYLNELENPVPVKAYSKDTKTGANGATVKQNDVITYSIKFTNVKKQKSTVTIMDNLSNGLKYVAGSSRMNSKIIAPKTISKTSNGTTLVWMQEIEPGQDIQLTYDVKVTGKTKTVKNKASIQYDSDPVVKLAELQNPLLIPEKKIIIPDTGSNIATIGVISGVVLVVAGGYLIYKRTQKSSILK